MKMEKKTILKICKTGFLVLVAYFLIAYFKRNINEIKELDFQIRWVPFLLSMIFYFVYKLSLASLWHYITKISNASIKYTNAISTYLYSILGKYIPGKVFMLAARFPAYDAEGIPLRKITVCFFLENICTLLGAAFLFVVSLFFFPNDILNDYKWLTLGLIVVFFICINPKIINFFLKYAEKIIKKKDMQIPFSYGQMFKVVLLFVANWLVVGLGFYMLICSIYPIPWDEMLYVGGIFGLSAIIGILAIFAPSGLGVREGIMIFGLTLIMPNEYAVIISIISRFWVTIAELILILVAFIVNKSRSLIRKKSIQE